MRSLYTAIFISALALPAFSAGQTPPPNDLPSDMTQIIRGILGELPENSGLGFPAPPSSSEELNSLAVRVTLQAPQTPERGEGRAPEWLVMSAYGPRADNPQRRGELLGETRILLRGLTAPYDVRVDVPAALQGDVTYIAGRIENKNGDILQAPLGGQLTIGLDGAPAELVMIPVQDPNSAPLPPSTPISAETVQGQISLSQAQDVFRGASLTVQLFEAGLAGGPGVLIRGEKQFSIDGLKPPYRFDLSFGVPKGGFEMPLQLQAFITDWAGRKTHVMAKGVDYNGPDFDYRLTLDALRQGPDVSQFEITAPPAAQSEVRGQIVFIAPRGLPRGAFLRLNVMDPLGPDGSQSPLSSRIIPVSDGDGRVDFSILAPSLNFDPELPAPILNITLESPNGIPLFERKNIPARENIPQMIELFPLTSY